MIDTSKYADDFMNGDSIKFSFIRPMDEHLLMINSIMAKILSRIDRMYLLDILVITVRELLLNAFKANGKRVFLESKGISGFESPDYAPAMEEFCERIIKKIEIIGNELNNSSYRIDFSMVIGDKGFYIRVGNNINIYKDELERINKRLDFARNSSEFGDAYKNFYDPSEGAGLGIMLSLMLMKSAGISIDNFKIIQRENYFETEIFFPDFKDHDDISKTVREKIIGEIEELPTFPEIIMKIQNIAADPDASVEKIAEAFSHDPSLTADILKFSNSAGFFHGKKIEKVSEAVMRIGLKNISIILAAAAAHKILSKRYKKFEQVWTHSLKTAEYSRSLCKIYGKGSISEKAYIAGLLHDIGYIILLSTGEDVVNILSEKLSNRKMKVSKIIDEAYLGLSHTDLGWMIAVKWNLPDFISNIIKIHHNPVKCSSDDVSKIVYLANMFCGIESQKYHYSYIEKKIYESFGIKNETELKEIHAELKEIII
jgi:putative nucleotidyltransferase with HDIG domain